MSNVGYATLSIIPSARGFGSALTGDLEPQMRSAGTRGGEAVGGGLLASAAKFAAPLAAAFGIGKFLSAGFGEVKDAAAGSAQLAAGIASTGNAAGVSVDSLNDLASTIQGYSGQTDDSIVASEKLLLTFTNIKNNGPDKIFDQATAATADMAARMGGDASGAAIQLGKALNDPVAGISALSRVGVSFTDQQKALIQSLVDTGDTAGAQKVILGELNKEFGGSAKAAGESLPGKIEILKRSYEDLAQTIVGGLTPILAPALGGIASLLEGISGRVGPFFDNLAAKGPAMAASFGGVLSAVSSAASGIFSILSKGDFTGGIFGLSEDDPIIGFLFDLRDTAIQVGSAFMEAIKPVAGAFAPIIPQILQAATSFSPLSIVLHALLPILPQLAGLVGQLATSLVSSLSSGLSILLPVIQQVTSILAGIFAAALPVVGQLVTTLGNALTQIIPAIQSVAAAVMPLVSTLLSALAPILTQLASTIFPIVSQVISAIVPIIVSLVGVLVALLVPAINNLLPVVTVVFSAVGAIISAVMQVVQGVIDVVLGVITGNWDQAWNGIQEILSGVWNVILGVVQGAINIVLSLINALIAQAGGSWDSFWGGFGGFVRDAWNNVGSAISAGISQAVGFVSGLPGQILGALSGLGSLLLNVGSNMMQGFINGVKDVAGGIADAVLGPIKDSVEGVKNFLGIHSPSRLMHSIGAFTSEGMANGLQSGAALVKRASAALVPTMPDVTAPTVAGGGLLGAVAASGSGDRPIYMDGGTLFGVIRKLANGEAQLVVDEALDEQDRVQSRGPRHWTTGMNGVGH